jgi:hypothetical protein
MMGTDVGDADAADVDVDVDDVLVVVLASWRRRRLESPSQAPY